MSKRKELERLVGELGEDRAHLVVRADPREDRRGPRVGEHDAVRHRQPQAAQEEAFRPHQPSLRQAARAVSC